MNGANHETGIQTFNKGLTSNSTLLVVDDEPGVVDAIREALHETDYRVFSTTNPRHALEILGADTPIDLLITDIFMPSMDGPTLLEKARRVKPELGALFTTGLASDQQLRKWRSRGQPIVAKPWTDRQLRDAVDRALRSTSTRKERQCE